MKVFALQTDIIWQNRQANHDKILSLLSEQTIPSGSLIVLPEMFDLGFSMDTDITSQSEDLPSDCFIKKLARTTQSCVLAGVVSPCRGDRPSNQALAVNHEGAELVRYTKTYLFSPAGEHEKYISGAGYQLFQWQDFKVAPFICYDLRFPELFRPAAKKGAQLMVVMANWPGSRSAHWRSLLQARAIENQCYMLGVNRCGIDPQISYEGGSVLFDPIGKIIVEAGDEEQVIEMDIESTVVDKWRIDFPALKDASEIK